MLPMRIVPDPILRQKAKRVSSIGGSLQRLIDDMIETMQEANGVGLAANQVGVLQRVVVIQLPEDEEPWVFINPEIIRREGEREVEEGCLSIPGYRGMVRRSVKVRAKGLDRNGKQVRVSAEELLAQALEHEIDHLDGTLYIDRLVSRDQLWKEEPREEPQEAPADGEPVEAGRTG
ncbi:MAG: peptide deformylase [Dehalococcoidia bacterium]|nr:peptide deformylase [Dehalococcoidia bacterium]